MEQQQKFYPVGIQTFSEIIGKNYLYIDKTGYVYRMTHSASKYMFLSRPRRFGKSLLASTLFRRSEGIVQRACYREIGDGMDVISSFSL